MTVPFQQARRSIATLWLVGGGALFVLVLLQTVMGHYGNNAEDVRNWLMPTVLPSASLALAVLARSSHPEKKTADRFLFRVAIALSSTYLLLVMIVILVQPLTSVPPIELLKRSNLLLGPYQGLVTAALGVFFERTDTSQQTGIA